MLYYVYGISILSIVSPPSIYSPIVWYDTVYHHAVSYIYYKSLRYNPVNPVVNERVLHHRLSNRNKTLFNLTYSIRSYVISGLHFYIALLTYGVFERSFLLTQIWTSYISEIPWQGYLQSKPDICTYTNLKHNHFLPWMQWMINSFHLLCFFQILDFGIGILENQPHK